MSVPKELDQVMKLRGGSVLGKKTILKSDHFPGCQNRRLSPQIDGAPNYRQADSLCVHGVAIPTVDGIRNVLNHIGAQIDKKQAKVLWISLREEPVVYINGRPFVLRDVERPFSNLEYTGINRARVEQMEARLKEDVLLEAARYGNKILVTDELPDGQMVDQWEPVTCESVKTPLEVYEELQVNGYLVDYERVPITDEKSPKEQDFDILVHRISQVNINTEIIFNCQMGRGRTTTGMVIATLVYLNRTGASERAALHPSSSGHCSFADWMRARPELYSIIRRLLRRDPMGALGYASLKPSLMKIAECTDGRPCEMGIVAARRSGEVLGSQTVLKSDHCPGCQNPSLLERVEGAPNFREVPGFPVYGVANPTFSGIQSVILRIGSSRGDRPVFWHNMREEPVIYINGKPFVLREVERPYKNMLEYTGIDRERVERMEARLKEDILREAEQYGGALMVIHETDDGRIFDAWEHVSSDVIQTPLEVFRSLEADGYPIKYARVPITDGKAPKSSDFDTLAANIASAPLDTAFVFNCQMGRGRTTTGTVIACLLKLRIDYGRPIRILLDDRSHEEVDGGTSSGEETSSKAGAPSFSIMKERTGKEQGRVFGINDILLLWKITTLFDNGVECREALDAIIDRCSALQNIRQAVLRYRKVFNQQHVEPRVRRVALSRGAEYLERYFRLIAFSAYLGSEAFDGFCGQGKSRMTFKDWLHQRPEVQAMKWSIRLRPGRFFTVPEELRAPHESQHGDAVMEASVKARNGSVLGKGSILKMYFFPGQRTSSHIQIQGAPHVYKVDGYPVYSMATPTIAGAKGMLAYLETKPITDRSVAQKVILTDLREEAVVYINGTPFVLRELNKPVDTLKHVGITGPVVEHMEARLKEDILYEVRQSGGRMLLHREEYSPSLNQSYVIGYWENIFTDDVKTPAEVYTSLKHEGYSIEYRRIPLTREREALASDVDAIQHCKDDCAGYYLFVSHTGFGGVAYAMAVICIRLGIETNYTPRIPKPLISTKHTSMLEESLPSQTADEEAHKLGDYRDILSLTRVLINGPKSKADVDIIIERCAGAGHLQEDILYYSKELEKFPNDDDEHRAYLMDMGIKALRRYFFLVAFRSYLDCTSATETKFTSWIESRPELVHLCNNLRIDK
ncbi:uncharacterized protein LOC131156522 isoform X4 [Malania oleifera]|uniref:uncharacterized protein LOC131156522 isoform X4 n=1 Tax=Malania oleifera TaxID=397392 RepID=UPI0025ADBD15|nr:uncharacterized protein LOC131156522 isoform X4 [Malania oleifera]